MTRRTYCAAQRRRRSRRSTTWPWSRCRSAGVWRAGEDQERGGDRVASFAALANVSCDSQCRSRARIQPSHGVPNKHAHQQGDENEEADHPVSSSAGHEQRNHRQQDHVYQYRWHGIHVVSGEPLHPAGGVIRLMYIQHESYAENDAAASQCDRHHWREEIRRQNYQADDDHRECNGECTHRSGVLDAGNGRASSRSRCLRVQQQFSARARDEALRASDAVAR